MYLIYEDIDYFATIGCTEAKIIEVVRALNFYSDSVDAENKISTKQELIEEAKLIDKQKEEQI